VILARAWGCAPADIRRCTRAEVDLMWDLLEWESKERKKRRG